MKNKNAAVFVVVLAFVMVAALMLAAGPQTTTAAPAPAPMYAPTPVAAGKAPSGETPRVVTLLDARSVSDDATGPCVEVSAFEKADIYYSVTIDGSNINTTTLTLQHGNSPTALTDGLGVASAVATDTIGLNQFALYGAYLCLKIDTTDASTGTVIVSADALLK